MRYMEESLLYNEGGTARTIALYRCVKGFFFYKCENCVKSENEEDTMSQNLEKTYNPKEIEPKLYE